MEKSCSIDELRLRGTIRPMESRSSPVVSIGSKLSRSVASMGSLPFGSCILSVKRQITKFLTLITKQCYLCSVYFHRYRPDPLPLEPNFLSLHFTACSAVSSRDLSVLHIILVSKHTLDLINLKSIAFGFYLQQYPNILKYLNQTYM